ncbi:hypothetical protein KRR55_16530 [Paeniglutamicibacter sp. ABSL32-1]|uniref:hypothetical protein n=1 Tax=Paeniglutamicibacter quisquiliarum TaxID=2849498 RepID=UPI001C2D7531|nr:hypothetical protein [Paeniglutamicibacter quisquiliarum]MBV1780723.1 hypothetical protein [Paeniglutamicibacter quisquiliarum]
MSIAIRVGFVDQITTDRINVLGWVRTIDGITPDLHATVGGKVLGSAQFGREREDVLKATGLRNRAFAIKLACPISAVEVLGGGLRVVTVVDGEEHLLPLSGGGELVETRLALIDLSSKVSGSASATIIPSNDYGEALAYAAEVKQAGQSGRLTPVQFPIGLRSRDNAAQLGHDGHIFLTEGSNNLLARYKEPEDLEEQKQLAQETQAWVNLIRERNEKITGNGMGFVQIVIPEKLTAMKELAPVHIAGPTPLFAKLEEALVSEQYWISGLGIFENWEGPIPPWQRNDSHNSAAGSLAITRALIAGLPGCVTDVLDDVPLVNRSYRDGDLAERFFGLPLWDEHLDPEPEFLAESGKGIDNVTAYNPAKGHLGTHMVWRNSKAPIQKSVVVFGNSFFGQSANSPAKLGWWFARLFAEYHLVWKPEIDYDYIDTAKPDYVIAQTIERFLGRFPST